MSIECTEYQFNSIKSHTKDIDVNNFNIIQRVTHLIIDCQQIQNEKDELTLNKMIHTLGEIIELSSNNDFARIKINDILKDFKQEVK